MVKILVSVLLISEKLSENGQSRFLKKGREKAQGKVANYDSNWFRCSSQIRQPCSPAKKVGFKTHTSLLYSSGQLFPKRLRQHVSDC